MHLYTVLAICGSLITFTAQSFGFDAGYRATQNIGACCYDDPDLGWTCIATSEPDCLAIYNGTWHSSLGCADIVCPPGNQTTLLPIDCREVVTTHFSGLDPSDNPDPDGAVLTLVDTRIPPVGGGGTPWPTAGQLWNPPLFSNLGAGPDEWTAKNLGTIFGLAFSSGMNPDIFVAASPGIFGNYDPNWPGVIGPAGAGGIYRIDGTTGQINNFTTLPNAGPGLGNIAIGTVANGTDLLYATNLDDGKIYAVDSLQTTLQVYDPFGANQTADGNFANLGERPFAVAVNPQGTRLYFSIWLRDQSRDSTPWPASAGSAPANVNNSIWSAQLDANGLIVGAPQLEVVLPYLSGTMSNPVTDISFTASGSMLVAERAFNGDYGMFDMGHSARILEYENNLPSSRNWSLGTALTAGVAANAVGGVSSDDDAHTWATCDQIVGGGTYGITRLPYPGNTLATRITSSIPIDIPGPLKNGMGEIDCMTCANPQVVGACCVTDTNGTDYCVEVTSQECATVYNGLYYGDGSDCATVTCGAPSSGACCYPDNSSAGWSCIYVTLNDCDNVYGGNWYSATTCANIICPPSGEGACCYEDEDLGWTCVWTDQGECDNYFYGTWYANIPCVDIECPDEPEGACCYVDADLGWVCNYIDPWSCNDLAGTWYSGIPCANIQCPAGDPLGACCYEDADLGWLCIYTTLIKCDDYYFGTWYGGVPCKEIICPPDVDVGACCYTIDCEWECNVMSMNDCGSYAGMFYANLACQDILCPDPSDGACCYEDANVGMICVITDIDNCLFNLGGTWHQEESCECIPCEPPPTAACCYTIDCIWYCDMLTFDNCEDLLGIFYNLSSCDDDSFECNQEYYGACCYENAAGVMTCVWTNIEKCEFHYIGIWHPDESCECIDCDPLTACNADAGSVCAGPPQYPYIDYTIFGSSTIGAQTASPSINGGSVLMLFDLNGPPLPLPVGVNLDPYIYNHPSWAGSGNDLGSIFGLAIDEDGNIYVSTSKTWNGGDPVGMAGWGAVYKINTLDASISLFASIPMPNNQSGLGSLTYDCEHAQFFVSSFEDGLIYRVDMAGNILDSFDHGTPYDPSVNGPVVFGDRPWAVEVNGDRLYYSMWNGNKNSAGSMPNEIWSVGLGTNGEPIVGTEHLEITMPLYSNDWSSPVADIDFSPTGTMVLGERMQLSITSLAAHEARVFEYECTLSGWVQSLNQFNVGSNGTDAAGGVDATDEYVWAAGDSLQFGPNYIYGFQGLPVTGGSVSNSVLVDYQGDVSSWQADKKMLGDLVITTGIDNDDGICCYSLDCEWTCDSMIRDDCDALDGTYYLGLTCDDIVCPNPDAGACCYEGAAGMECDYTTETTCLAQLFGIWHASVPCKCIECDPPPPTGACCYMDINGTMVCGQMEEIPCLDLPAATYYGTGSLCNGVVCCAPVGGCCILGDCLLASADQCATAQGRFAGLGNDCSTMDCDKCIGDLNNNDLVGVEDLLILIAAWGVCP